MAVEILIGHIPATESAAALAQVHAEHAALYAGVDPVDEPHAASPPGGELTAAAVHSLDPHQVRLVEACRRDSRPPAIRPSRLPRKQSPACADRCPSPQDRGSGRGLP